KDMGRIRDEVLACLGDPIGLEPVPSPSAPWPPQPPLPEEFQQCMQREAERAGRPGAPLTHALASGGTTLALAWKPADALVVGAALWLLKKDGQTVTRTSPLPLGPVMDLKFTPDDKLLIGACFRGIVVWTVPDLKVQSFFPGGAVNGL